MPVTGLDNVLKRLKAGEFDGGMSMRDVNGTTTIMEIRDGEPKKIYHGKTIGTFDGKENTKSSKMEVTNYETDEKKKDFIQQYGFIGDLFGYDEEAKQVSGEYYEEKKRRMK